MYFIKYQLFYIFLLCFQFSTIIIGDYSGYQASLPRDNFPQKTHPFVEPYYHSRNDYENHNYDFWYENKPLPHYHGNVPITIHQHYLQEEHFIDDESYVTDPPGFSLTKYKQNNLQKLSTNKNNNFSHFKKNQLPKARLSGSESFNGKNNFSQPNTIKNQLTKSEEQLLKEIENEIAIEEKKKEKSTNLIVEDITSKEENRKKGKITTDLVGTSISTIKSTEDYENFAKLPPGTQPDPFSHLPKVPIPANTYFENDGKKESKYKTIFENDGKKENKYKTIFENEVNIIEPDNDKNQGSDYMDDLDKMSTEDKKPLTSTPPTTTTKKILNEKVGNDYDLISYENKKTTYGEEDNADFFASETNKSKLTTNLEKSQYIGENKENEENETIFPSNKKESDKIKKCCPCCDLSTPSPNTLSPNTLSPNTLLPNTLSPNTLSPNTLSPKTLSQYEFTQFISNRQGFIPASTSQNNYGSSYIPTGAELAARYGVPYPSMVSEGKSCGPPSIPCIGIPYIPPPCCLSPPPKCCLPTIPCCPKIQVSCCPQTAICCEPNHIQYQQSKTSCNSCKSKTIMKYRSKRNTCLPCKYNKRSKRFDLFNTIYPEINQHLRVKRFGCIPCFHKRVKRTPLKSNCQTCSGNGNMRTKRTINCTLCTAGKLSVLNRNKRDTIYDSPGYDNIFNCDKSCCDYSRCDELSAKPLQPKKKNLN
uniref:Uncharacterized protein n=1 Tax=Strongyloides stercoralis TaxID=6248 RepID=A0A0K0E9S3_STRER